MAEAAKENNNNGKKKRAFLIVGVAVLVGLIAGYAYTVYRRAHLTTDDAFIEGNIHISDERWRRGRAAT